MKTLKVLSFIVLIIAVFTALGTGFGFSGELSEYKEFFQKHGAPVENINLNYIEHSRHITNLGGALGFLALGTPICALISLIVAITNRKNYYGGFISGFFQLIPFLISIWALSAAKSLAADLGYYSPQQNNYFGVLNYAPLKANIYLLFSPMVIQFIDGIVKTVRHKKGKDIPQEPVKSAQYIADNIAKRIIENTPQTSNAAEIKQYKELLDIGAISQAEYDAKKKQLLGLPETYNAQTAVQNVGRCVICGCENVVLENVDVNIAGTMRKRTMCTACAAKYR